MATNLGQSCNQLNASGSPCRLARHAAGRDSEPTGHHSTSERRRDVSVIADSRASTRSCRGQRILYRFCTGHNCAANAWRESSEGSVTELRGLQYDPCH
jgi:hypothetical protein